VNMAKRKQTLKPGEGYAASPCGKRRVKLPKQPIRVILPGGELVPLDEWEQQQAKAAGKNK
jgi:hypothetical protein